MSTKKKGTSAPRRAALGDVSATKFPDKLRRKLLPLIKGFTEGSPDAYQRAAKALQDIVFGPIGDSVSIDDNLVLLLACALSGQVLPGYATLDFDHVREIKFILDAIKSYSEDSSQKRPLNFLMLASPGAGKSHFIKCIAAKLGAQNIGAVTYNMVGLQRHEDLIPPLDAARNFKVEDRLPLLFLDEFDVHENNYPLLLPLLWDGQLTLGPHDLKLGKVVVVLAGSDPRLPLAMEHARSMRADSPQIEGHHPKLVDLLSRINGGVIRIPSLSDPLHLADRRADKICITVVLLRHRFGPLLAHVPLALLRFVASAEFRYGVRSIAHLIDLIPYSKGLKELKLSGLGLPVSDANKLKASSLAYHLLSEDQAHGIVKAWREASATSAQVLISQDILEFLTRPLILERQIPAGYVLDRLWFDLRRAQLRTMI
jgi:hypothetical protein